MSNVCAVVALLIVVVVAGGQEYHVSLGDELADADAPLVALLFSASWCSSCTEFRGSAVQLHEQHGVPVVLLSRERNAVRHERAVRKYGSITAVPYMDERRQAYNAMFDVKVLPTLVLLQRVGDERYLVLDEHGYHTVLAQGVGNAAAYWRGLLDGTVQRVNHKAAAERKQQKTATTSGFAPLRRPEQDEL